MTGSNRVMRGGTWNNNASNCRSANRNNNSPGTRNNNFGFRLASSPRCETARVHGRAPGAPVVTIAAIPRPDMGTNSTASAVGRPAGRGARLAGCTAVVALSFALAGSRAAAAHTAQSAAFVLDLRELTSTGAEHSALFTIDLRELPSISTAYSNLFTIGSWAGSNFSSRYSNLFTIDLRGPTSLGVSFGNFRVANLSTSASHFDVWLDATAAGASPYMLNGYRFRVVSLGDLELAWMAGSPRRVGEVVAGGTRVETYSVPFEVRRRDPASGAPGFTGGRLEITSTIGGPTSTVVLPSQDFDLAVWGTDFDMATDAYPFKNGRWAEAPGLSEAAINAAKVVQSFLSPFHATRFWETLGESGGMCYGMASSSVSRFVHRRDRDYWGEHCDDGDAYCDWNDLRDNSWRTAILSRDDELGSGNPPSNSPLPTWESLAAASGTADRIELEAFKKILYYHVAQPVYSNLFLPPTHWVGRDGFGSAFSVVDATLLLSAGRPGLFSFQLPDLTSISGLSGHTVVLAQALSLNGSALMVFYDNNLTVTHAKANDLAPFVLLDLPPGTEPSRPGLTLQLQFVSAPNARFRAYDVLSAQLLPWNESDSQWIYGSPRPQHVTTEEVASRSAAAEPAGLSDSERQLLLDHGYARLVLVGAESFTVFPEGGTTPLVAIPAGELDGSNVVVHGGAGALTTTVYLPAPVGVRCRVEIVKSATSPVLMVYEDVPAGGDSLDAIGYEALETGPTDRTRAAITVGRGNTSLDATRTSDSGVVDTVAPTFAELATLAVPAVDDLIARREGAVVRLSWVNPVHPGFSGVTVIRTAGSPARTTADGVAVFQGSGTTAEDTPASDGVVYYTVFSMSAGQPVASTAVSIVPTRACIAGSVSGDGQPVARAQITVEAQGGTLLSTASGDDGQFSVCDLAAGRYTVRCEKTGVTFPAATQELLVGDESMTLVFEGAVVETLTLVSPVGGERWTVGSTQYVGWTTSGAIPNVRVELSRDGGATWETLAGPVSNGGALAVSVTAPKSARCLVRVTAVGGTASSQSTGTFSVVGSSPVHRHLPR